MSVSWHFLKGIIFYSSIDGFLIGVFGITSGITSVEISSNVFESSNFDSSLMLFLTPGRLKFDSKMRTNNSVANTQVLLSKKSPVF